MIGTIKGIQSIQNILGCMRVHDIKEDDDTHSVGSINEFSKLFGCAVSRTRGKEASNLVSEGWKTIIGASQGDRNVNLHA